MTFAAFPFDAASQDPKRRCCAGGGDDDTGRHLLSFALFNAVVLVAEGKIAAILLKPTAMGQTGS